MSQANLVGSMLIVGAAVSIVMNVLKARYGSLHATKSKVLLVVISVALGALYHVMVATGVWATAYMILSTASVVYAFFFKK